jgi:hypothetical protein
MVSNTANFFILLLPIDASMLRAFHSAVVRTSVEDRGSVRLLSATAIERMAVVSGVTVVPNARIAGVALTGMQGYKALAAMGKALELDGGNCILRK